MNRYTYVAAIAAAVMALGFTTAALASDTVTEAQIAAASTPGDHEAIAQSYDQEAAAAEMKAQGHDNMAKTYRMGGSPKGSPASMASHCDRLASSYRTAAAEYRALATEHRKMAVAASK